MALFGIGHLPSSNRIQVGSVCLFSCCALTAQMVPHLLSCTATIESVDPVGRRLVRLTSAPARIQSTDPSGASATLVVTTEEGVQKDIASAFCTHIHHFPNVAFARAFASADPRRYVVSVEELHEAAPTHRGPLELSLPENARRVPSPSWLTPSRGSLDGGSRYAARLPRPGAARAHGVLDRHRLPTAAPGPSAAKGGCRPARKRRRRPAGCRLLVTKRNHRIELRRAQGRVEAERKADQN